MWKREIKKESYVAHVMFLTCYYGVLNFLDRTEMGVTRR